jgi:hypothetical protein
METRYQNVKDDPDRAFLNYPGSPASWVPILSTETAAAMRADNRGVTVTYQGRRFLIPQYRARSLDDFQRSVDKFRSLESREGGILCLFRGQTRDYFDATGSLGCLPAGYRTARWRRWYHGADQTQLESKLVVWDRILVGEFGIEIGSAVGFEQSAPGFRRFYADRSPEARVSTNIMLLSILQHYGFPTPSLDVTADPLIALWFASHVGTRATRGRVRYEPVHPVPTAPVDGTPQQLSEIPSVLIFLQNPRLSAVNDLTSVEALRGIADRPFRQEAVLLPFEALSATPVELPWGPPGGPYYRPDEVSLPSPKLLVSKERRQTHRVPAAMIKVCFGAEELRSARPELTAEYLFPTTEILYSRLLTERAPHLAVYV